MTGCPPYTGSKHPWTIQKFRKTLDGLPVNLCFVGIQGCTTVVFGSLSMPGWEHVSKTLRVALENVNS